MYGDNEFFGDEMMGAAKAAPAGPRQNTVMQKQAAVAKLRAEAKDKAIANKALVGEKSAYELWVDPVSGKVYRAWQWVLTQDDFSRAQNIANAETVVATYTVPTGQELLFRSVNPGAKGAFMDRQAPYLYGQILTSALAQVGGVIRIKVFDATANDLKGQPFTGSSLALNAADPIDWNKRLHFNCMQPVRAHAGDSIQITFKSATQMSTTASYYVLYLTQLSEQ